MMDWTDVHYRQLARIISKHTWLWTEMVVDNTVIHTDRPDMHLWFPPEQRPIVCQMGGSEPELLRKAAKKVAEYGYDEINLNCGCPSDRVAGAGCFGAAMMLQPDLVARCMNAIQEGCGELPVTVKCRIGVDDIDDYASMCNFVRTVSECSPVTHFIVHSRKCFLKGLNPAQNRSVPPLHYSWVFALKRDFPHLNFSLNGGIQGPEEAREVLRHTVEGARVHGVMIGRAAYNMPWQTLAQADTMIFGAAENAAQSRRQVLADYCKYADPMLGRWFVKPDGHKSPSMRVLIRPLLNMFHGERGSKKWKSAIDFELTRKDDPACSVSELMARTLPLLADEVLDAPPASVVPNFEMFTAEQTGDWPPAALPPPFGLATSASSSQSEERMAAC